MKPIRVLIVDDSALIRQMLSGLLQSDPEIEVVGVAPDPIIARERIKSLNPDVVTLDIDMPHMDGIAFLEKIMTLRPMPVVMVSSLTQRGAEISLQALEIGAVDCVAKPVLENAQEQAQGLMALRDELIAKVKSAAGAKLRHSRRDEPRPRLSFTPGASARNWVVAIGASTGGVEALNELLSALPENAPPILVTQHMPRLFTAAFAQRLNRRCAVTVKEAENGDPVEPGHVYIAPGGAHLELSRADGKFICRVSEGELVSGHCPSVDVLFGSVARVAGRQAVGVILTGMGKDGAAGLLSMRRAGARTIGEAEASCVVYGMPKAARQLDAVEAEFALSRIAPEIMTIFAGESSTASCPTP